MALRNRMLLAAVLLILSVGAERRYLITHARAPVAIALFTAAVAMPLLVTVAKDL